MLGQFSQDSLCFLLMYMVIRNRDRGTNERTWTIVLYLKAFAGLPETCFFNCCSLEFRSQESTERITIRK